MPDPLPNPIRVLVKGPSNVSWISFMNGPRTDFAFPRVIESELLAAGHPARVEAISVPSELGRTTLRRWEREIIGWSPDVIILTYGQYEAVHLFLPRWLERHANSLKARPGRIRELYRQRVLRPVWMALARLQRWADRTVDPTVFRWRERRLAADLRQFITQVQQVGTPLVYVIEVLPPASRRDVWFPGMAARIELTNRLNREMIESFGRDNIRFFRTSELVTKYADGDLDAASPDGFHYSPEMHAAIGKEFAREILDWAATQPHLQLPEPPPRRKSR
jgi:hypothetical protein